MPAPLDHIRSIVELPAEIESRLKEAMSEIHFRRGDHVTSLNEMRDNLFYIVRGSARLFYTSAGKEHTFSFALENEVLLMSRVLLQSPDMVVSVEFLEPSEVVVMSHNIIRDALRSITDPKISDALTNIWSTGLIHYCNYLEERVLMLQNTSALSRYRWMCSRYPRIVERATVTQIASFLGITRETLYRIRSGKYGPANAN